MDTRELSSPTTRLGIIHLLGWMLGCGAVLAIYRLNMPATPTLPDLLRHLGLGLAYGTAASGLGLFLWRWRTGSGPAPTQPGHWLLIFGGLGMLIDMGTTAPYLLALKLGVREAFVWWLCQQLAAWSIATLIGLVVLTRLRGASRTWTTAAWIIVFALGLNAAADITSLIGIRFSAGTWTWYLPIGAHLASVALALPPIWGAELADRLRGVPRDWLHYTGIASVSILAVVDFTIHYIALRSS